MRPNLVITLPKSLGNGVVRALADRLHDRAGQGGWLVEGQLNIWTAGEGHERDPIAEIIVKSILALAWAS